MSRGTFSHDKQQAPPVWGTAPEWPEPSDGGRSAETVGRVAVSGRVSKAEAKEERKRAEKRFALLVATMFSAEGVATELGRDIFSTGQELTFAPAHGKPSGGRTATGEVVRRGHAVYEYNRPTSTGEAVGTFYWLEPGSATRFLMRESVPTGVGDEHAILDAPLTVSEMAQQRQELVARVLQGIRGLQLLPYDTPA